MKHLLVTLVVGLVSAGAAVAADANKMVLRWHGQSFFELETSKHTRIVFDPHALDVYGRISVRADLVLVSHYHTDHTQIGVVENRDKKVIVGLTGDGKKIDWNLVDEKFKDVRIRTVGVYHDTTQGMERGKNAVFVVEADGLRIVFLGDLGHTLTEDQIKQIGPVDVLMIPVGGIYTLNGADAKKVVEQLKPKRYILPMHYGTDVFDEVLPVDEFIEDEKNVKKLAGNRLEIDPNAKQAGPIIAVLNWK